MDKNKIIIIVLACVIVIGAIVGIVMATSAEKAVTFVDGEIVTKVIEQGGSITAPDASTIPGKEFIGWYCGEKAFSAETYEIGETYVAKYTYIDYTVVFENDDGSVIKTSNYKYGDTIVPPFTAPVKVSTAQYDYHLTGYKGYTDGMTVTKDVVFKALYEEVLRSYKITLMINGKVYKTETLTYGTVYTPEAIELDGYDFMGWDIASLTVVGDEVISGQLLNVEEEKAEIRSKLQAEIASLNKFIYTENGWNQVLALTTNYDALIADAVTIKQAAALKNEFVEKLTETESYPNMLMAYVNELDSEAYYEEEWAEINELLAAAKIRLLAYNGGCPTIEKIFSDAKESIDSVATIEEDLEIAVVLKGSRIRYLREYAAENDVEGMAELFAEAEQKINEAVKSRDVSAVYAEYYKKMKALIGE